MSTEPIESLMKRITDRYNKKPDGWSVLIDPKGSMLVLGPRIGYRFKLIPLNPKEYTGVGLKISSSEEMRRIVEGIPFYGFRPLPDRETKELLNSIHQGGINQNKLIKKLLGMKPVPTWELREKAPKAVLSGPILAHPDLSAISKSQQELEMKLAIEADKLFRKKYPHRATIYG